MIDSNDYKVAIFITAPLISFYNFLGVSITGQRMLSMHTVNENLYLCTDKPRDIHVDKKDLRY